MSKYCRYFSAKFILIFTDENFNSLVFNYVGVTGIIKFSGNLFQAEI